MTASIFLFDGSGASDNETYHREMWNVRYGGAFAANSGGSFIWRINRSAKIAHKYFRGPSALGTETAAILEAGKKHFLAHPDFARGPVFIAGYSRGGYIAIEFARWLKARKVPVKAMFLFDAVDRDISVVASEIKIDRTFVILGVPGWLSGASLYMTRVFAENMSRTNIIPSNVENAYHVYRDPAAGSRSYFGNCGLAAEGGTRFWKHKVFGTHAGLGGIPWTGDHPTVLRRKNADNNDMTLFTRYPGGAMGSAQQYISVPLITERQDHVAAATVKAAMWAFLERHGVL